MSMYDRMTGSQEEMSVGMAFVQINSAIAIANLGGICIHCYEI